LAGMTMGDRDMDKTLCILILEDNLADADLIQFELEEAGIAFTAKVVMTEAAFVRELQESPPDLIFSDYNLPGYNGTLALIEAKRQCPDVPFILITGAIGEDRAIEILTQGAKDYIMKSRLNRLVPAVQRALAEAKEHRARREAEAKLHEMYKNLEIKVEERTAALQTEIAERTRIEEKLRLKSESLEETNLALKVLLRQVEEGKKEFEAQILSNIRELVLPYIRKLKNRLSSQQDISILEITESNLDQITSSFLRNLKLSYYKLTPREIEIAALVLEGKSIKDIAELLNVTTRTVEFYRSSLRKKLGLKNKKTNLRSHLMTLQ
jgi:DNA-binding NarL/FixJ family response regulator